MQGVLSVTCARDALRGITAADADAVATATVACLLILRARKELFRRLLFRWGLKLNLTNSARPRAR